MWAIRSTNDWAAFVARLAFAIMIVSHGVPKAFGWFGSDGFQAACKALIALGRRARSPRPDNGRTSA